MSRERLLVASLLAAAALLPLAGCGGRSDPWAGATGPKVVATFAPIACFARNVAGPDATVKTVLTTQGPHSAETPLAQAVLLKKADLFFSNGLGLDDKIVEKLKLAGGGPTLKVVDLGVKIARKDLEEMAHDHDAGHDHKHTHAKDPHVWLGLDHATTFVTGIRDELKQIDPAHAADYDRRTADYAATLAQVKADGVALLKDKKERSFVSFHESLTYFAKSFELEIAAVLEKTPGQEPTPAELQKIISQCLEEKVRVIAVEPQYSSQSSAKYLLQALKDKGLADVVLVEIDPCETADPADLTPGWYEAKMRANLSALAGALK